MIWTGLGSPFCKIHRRGEGGVGREVRDEKTRQEIGRERGTDKQRDRHKQRYIEIKRQSVRANGPRGKLKG